MIVAGYWGDRGEDVVTSATRLHAALMSFADESPIFGRWLSKGRRASRLGVVQPADISIDQVADLLAAGVHERDFAGGPITELGWYWSAWNGRNDIDATVSVQCGATTGQPGILNRFLVRLPAPTAPAATNLYQREVTTRLVAAVGAAWAPDYVVANSHRLREARTWAPRQPEVGWMTYLRTSPGTIVVPRVRTVRLVGGYLVSIEAPWAEVGVDQVLALADVLERQGALTPIA